MRKSLTGLPSESVIMAILTTANVASLLKSGGIVGIVQHHARDNMSDSWANGENGYLKKGYVVDMMESAGFNLVGESDINANDKDRPTGSEYVWRLPPDGNMKEIGEALRVLITNGTLKKNITYVLVKNTRLAQGIISSNFYNNPSKGLNIIGITGTNGKTTTTSLLYNIFLETSINTYLGGNIGVPFSENILKEKVS